MDSTASKDSSRDEKILDEKILDDPYSDPGVAELVVNETQSGHDDDEKYITGKKLLLVFW